MTGPSPQAVMKEVFALFDRDGDGLIIGIDIPFVIRATGVNPSDAEMDKLLNGRDQDMFDFQKFEAICGPLLQGHDVRAEMRKAFKPFDRDNSGELSSGELKHVMRNLKTRLADSDVDRLIECADPNNTGKIAYDSLIDMLLC